MLNKILTVLLAASAFSATAAPLLGSTVRYEYRFPELSTVYGDASNGNYVVGAGVEIPSSLGLFSVDITSNQVIIDFSSATSWTGAAFNGFQITDVFGAIDPWTVSLDASSNMAGLDASRLAFGADFLQVNWNGLSFNSDTRVVLNVVTASAVPEPGSLALLGLGLAGIVAVRRRKA